MTTLSQIADKATKELLPGWTAPDKEDSEEVARVVIQALIDTPWNCPSEINEQVAKSMIKKYVLEEERTTSSPPFVL